MAKKSPKVLSSVAVLVRLPKALAAAIDALRQHVAKGSGEIGSLGLDTGRAAIVREAATIGLAELQAMCLPPHERVAEWAETAMAACHAIATIANASPGAWPANLPGACELGAIYDRLRAISEARDAGDIPPLIDSRPAGDSTSRT